MPRPLALAALALCLFPATLGCSDRVAGEDFAERVRTACTAACERRHECVAHPGTPSPEECIDYCLVWKNVQQPGECADGALNLMECLGDLTCDEYQLREDRREYLDPESGEFTVEIPCEDAELEFGTGC